MPPPTPWAIPCHEQVVELDTVQHIGTSLESRQTYRVIVNDRETTTFTLPDARLRDTFIAESPIESVEVVTLESTPPGYQLHVVSGLPKGSGCSQFNGYEIRRGEPNRIDVAITHHEVADPFVVCTFQPVSRLFSNRSFTLTRNIENPMMSRNANSTAMRNTR